MLLVGFRPEGGDVCRCISGCRPPTLAACAPIAALFAIATKVGVYSIVRVHWRVFGAEPDRPRWRWSRLAAAGPDNQRAGRAGRAGPLAFGAPGGTLAHGFVGGHHPGRCGLFTPQALSAALTGHAAQHNRDCRPVRCWWNWSPRSAVTRWTTATAHAVRGAGFAGRHDAVRGCVGGRACRRCQGFLGKLMVLEAGSRPAVQPGSGPWCWGRISDHRRPGARGVIVFWHVQPTGGL